MTHYCANCHELLLADPSHLGAREKVKKPYVCIPKAVSMYYWYYCVECFWKEAGLVEPTRSTPGGRALWKAANSVELSIENNLGDVEQSCRIPLGKREISIEVKMR